MSDDKEEKREEITEEEVEKIDEGELSPTKIKDEQQVELTCSSCGTINPKTNLFCKNCGTPFVQKIVCSKCNAEMPVYNSFCSKCGGVLKQTVPRLGETSSTHVTPHPSQHQSIQSQNYYVAPPPINQSQALEQMRLARYQTYNLIGTVVGALSIFAGIVGIIIFFIMLAFSPSVLAELGNQDQASYYYGSLSAMFLPASITFIIVGASLITYRPDGNAWKGFYYTLRFIFVGFSSILALFSVIIIVSWIFYNPTTPVNGSTPFWLFFIIEIPVTNFPLVAFIAILLIIFLSGVILMEIPTIIRLVKKYKKNNLETFESDQDYFVEEIKTERVALELDKEKKIFQETGVKLSLTEKRKGLMPTIFYHIKSNPLIGSFELLGASYFTSFILVLILTAFAPATDPGTGTEPEAPNPFITILTLAWAGVFEEISFRLIIIGLPMILVMLVRYLRQSRDASVTKHTIPEDRMKVLEEAEQSGSEKILLRDILLAFRGKYKKIGYIEWILIAISSILFGFAHWEKWTGSWPAWKIVQAGVAGLFLSYAFVKYGIESSIFIHVCNNVIIGLAVFSAGAGAGWIEGIASFIIVSLMTVGILKLISVIIGFAINLYYRRNDSARS